jgi:hypothetical protein
MTSRGLSTLRPLGPIVFLPQQVPAFTSRGATIHTDARGLYQRRRELLIMNFASKSGIYEVHQDVLHVAKLGHGTWDILFHCPSEGRHTEDFLDIRKIQPAKSGSSKLTARSPKPATLCEC